MKKYRQLATYSIVLNPKEEQFLDAVEELVLIPKAGKVFLHWLTPKQKLASTLTLTEPTLISSPVKIINGPELQATIQVLKL